MYCSNCGTQLAGNEKFCHNCGSAVTGPSSPSPKPVVSVEQPAAAPIPQEQQVNQAPVTPVLDKAAPQPSPAGTNLAVKPKKRHTGLIIGICVGAVALLLAITLLAGYFLDWFQPESRDDDDREESSSQHEEDPTVETEPVEKEPNTPVEVELNVKEAELVYELTDDDVAAYYELLAVTEELVIKGEDEDAVMEAVEDLDDSFSYLQSQLSVATVLHYCDLEDTDASDLYLSCTEIVTEANDEYIKMCRRVYESDSPAKDVFFEEWTELDMKLLMAYSDEVMTLIQRNSEIEVEYQKLQDESNMYTAMVPLYIEMVQNNNRIAQLYGYDNYYEYAYEVEYMRDYDPEQIKVMRTYVAEYIPDALEDVTERFLSNMEDLGVKEYEMLSYLLFEPYEEGAEDYITGYLKTLPEQARNDMLDMFHGNIMLMEDADDAMEGAFTTTIGTDRQVCFFGPGYNNAMTLVHEVGHYYGGCHQYLDDLPLDLAETHSQGNEWLFMQYLKSELSDDAYQALVDYRFINDLSMITICVIIDEFEQQVYTHPNVASLTSNDLDKIMEDVCVKYGGIDYLSTNYADIQEYWRMVVVEQPVYYISYAVSSVASMDLYSVAKNDYDAAIDIYQDLIENADLEDGFLGNITAAGLSSPFDEKFYQGISELTKDER